jgi:solute:Na+ symporter, SSS family
LFYKRVNAAGAMAALVGGAAIGALRIILELNKASLTGFLFDFASVNFLYFCIILFAFCMVLMIGVSLCTATPEPERLNGLTFATTMKEDKDVSRSSWNRTDVILSLIVIIFVVAVFIYFSPLGVAS